MKLGSAVILRRIPYHCHLLEPRGRDTVVTKILYLSATAALSSECPQAAGCRGSGRVVLCHLKAGATWIPRSAAVIQCSEPASLRFLVSSYYSEHSRRAELVGYAVRVRVRVTSTIG